MDKFKLYSMNLVIHPKDHEPDWHYDVCRMCGLGRIREVEVDAITETSPAEGGERT